MIHKQPVVCEQKLRRLLQAAAEQSAIETRRHCQRMTLSEMPDAESLEHEEGLAWVAAQITQAAWALLEGDEPDQMAPIAWTVQELMEWAVHVVRFELLGDMHVKVPLTWWPSGECPFDTRDMATAVEERLSLLREELSDVGVVVGVTSGRGVAA